jgi:hypothetical protein
MNNPFRSSARTLKSSVFIAILHALVKALDSRLRIHYEIVGRYDKSTFLESLQSDSIKRRKIIEALVQMYSVKDFEKYPLGPSLRSLLTLDDFFWLIDAAVQNSIPDKKDLFILLAREAWNYSDVDAYAKAFDAQLAHPEVRRHFGDYFAVIHLDSEVASRNREYHRRSKSPNGNIVQKDFAQFESAIEDELSKSEQGDASAWWRLNYWLLPDEKLMARSEYTPDIRRYPGWDRAAESRRERLRAAARRYAVEADTNPVEWQTSAHRPGASGYRALFLIAAENPALISALDKETFSKWAKPIVSYPATSFADADLNVDRSLVALAFQCAPREALEQLAILLDTSKDKYHLECLLRRLDNVHQPELNSSLEVALEKAMDDAQWEALLFFLLEHNSDRARRIAEAQVSSTVRTTSGVRRRVIAAKVLFIVFGVASWQLIWTRIKKTPKLGREVLGELPLNGVMELPSDSLANVYIWLVKNGPVGEPRMPRFLSAPGRERLSEIRYLIPGNLAKRGSWDGVRALERITIAIGRSKELDYHLAAARERFLELSWQPIAPKHIARMLVNTRARAVRSSNELLSVILEELAELDKEMQGTPAVAEFLWNVWRRRNKAVHRPKDEGSISNYVAFFLRNRLQARGIVVNREVEIRRGEETDVHVDAVNPDPGNYETKTVRAIIEVKGCWHPEVRTAIKTQLADRYLKDTQDTAGLYVVGWFLCSRWNDPGDRRKAKTPRWNLSQARKFFEQRASCLSQTGIAVKSFVLNTSIR